MSWRLGHLCPARGKAGPPWAEPSSILGASTTERRCNKEHVKPQMREMSK